MATFAELYAPHAGYTVTAAPEEIIITRPSGREGSEN